MHVGALPRKRAVLLWFTLAMACVAAPARATTVYAVGDIAECKGDPTQSNAYKTAQLIPVGARILIAGDTAYPWATKDVFESCFEPTWGKHRSHAWVVPGNHDYQNGVMPDFLSYFGDATDPRGYFARAVGSWLVIGLDSDRTGEAFARQQAWLESMLRGASKSECILAFWHHPVFSSGQPGAEGHAMKAAWELLQHYGADLIVNGHAHFYEAFEPRDALGNESTQGIREIIVGTGGASSPGFGSQLAPSRIRMLNSGVLRLELESRGYRWAFITVDGQTADQGSASCHTKLHS